MAAPHYEIIDERFRALVLPNARLETLADGIDWLEGPVWFGDHDSLIVSDLPGDRLLRWSASSGLVVHRQPSGFENGHARDRQGRLIGCSHRHRCITRVELDGTVTVLADRHEGRRLNSPNDVVVKRDGSIWFTDPPYGIQTDYEGGKQVSELPARIYRLDPETRSLTVVSEAYQGPNGLCFSPDESLLYVSETGLQFAADPLTHIKVHRVSTDGRSLDDGRVFYRVSPGNADGIRCDEAGRLWSSAGDGVHCISPEGELLGKILIPDVVSNLCFGGRGLSQLFICASHTLMAIYTNTRGVPLV